MESAAKERLWQHAMHEDAMFGERLNSFLIIESVLLALVALLKQGEAQGAGPGSASVLPWFAVLGAGLTVALWFVQAKHRAMVKLVAGRAREHFPELKETEEILKTRWWWRGSGSFVLAHVVPAVLLSIWIALIFFL